MQIEEEEGRGGCALQFHNGPKCLPIILLPTKTRGQEKAQKRKESKGKNSSVSCVRFFPGGKTEEYFPVFVGCNMTLKVNFGEEEFRYKPPDDRNLGRGLQKSV